MQYLKSIFAGLSWFAISIVRLPRSIHLRLRVARRQIGQNRAEAERIDRIRHPHKYRGK